MYKNNILVFIFSIGLYVLLLSCNAPQEPTAHTGMPTVSSSKTTKETLSPISNLGKKWFLEYCAACHNINMVDDMTGPALYGVEERWEKRSDLIQFIQNPQELVNNNHPRAVAVSTKWPSEMTAFPQLDSVEIVQILTFIEERGKARSGKKK